MKHIFFAYPAGQAGLALLLMRASVAVALVAVAPGIPSKSWIDWLFYLVAAGIGAGVSTRVLGGLAALACAILAWPLQAGAPLPLLAHALAAVALALIGPGAFSVDARLFGRSTIHLAE